MDQLLCHLSESTVSRHKVTRHAEASFSELGHGMSNCSSWPETLRRAQDGEADKKRRKRAGSKAPGLHSAATILAVLIISHPDPDSKFRQWIGRLQIDWMLTHPRNILDVQDGNRKGLNSENLHIVFAAESEPRRAEVEMLADYNRLFGQDFSSCRKDIRPFLPPVLAASLAPLTEALFDVNNAETHDEAVSHVPEATTDDDLAMETVPDTMQDTLQDPAVTSSPKEIPSQAMSEEARRLRERLNANDVECDMTLESWLLVQLEGQDDILAAWCRHWEAKIEAATSYNDQMLIRSLFTSSLGRLQRLHTATNPLANALMLVDLLDAQISTEEAPVIMSALLRLGPFKAYEEANNRLLPLIESHTASQICPTQSLIAQQIHAFYHFTQHSPHYDHWADLFSIEALYTQLIVGGYRETAMKNADLES